MSNDRKPGRVRVLKAQDNDPGRRRNDTDPIVVDGTPSRGKSSRGALFGLIGLFLIAVVACAAGTELYLP